MAKQLKFTYKDTDYVLEFTRRTVQQMERNDFIADDLTTKPMTTLPKLFAGAFLANHRFVKRKEIDEIYDHMTNKDALLEKLIEMYNEPFATLFDDPEDGAEGNVTWEASF